MRFFFKILSSIDIQQKLTIPSDSLAELKRTLPDEGGNYSIKLPVKDESGREWSFLCTFESRFDTSKGFFSSGWVDFARSRSLKAGDTIYFRKEHDHTYKIETRISNDYHCDSFKKARKQHFVNFEFCK
ncbi:hypothetical protein Pint_30500 [Pistacia integerrima]|uniref:Uncharacterized protein n=1 Tax=Pistacia integerrima TaxID=434235 RepID=A0ACC0X568_9ROSI|nr:hypothetical protein Pint_30500 [Pistacia integerrima]